MEETIRTMEKEKGRTAKGVVKGGVVVSSRARY